jgi:CRISPR-associated protein Csb2
VATLRLRFPGGRYHATPWGHHVNEGLIEWPPCPWRLLRALIATGYAKLGWTSVPPAGRRLIEALAGTLPVYRLPASSAAHSRHYMPLGVLDKGREKTALVFDTWANVAEGDMVVRWDCQLDDEARAVFSDLTAGLAYLGRSESWVAAEVLADDADLPPGADSYPHHDACNPGAGWEQVSMMAAHKPEEYQRWRKLAVEEAIRAFPLPEGKKSPTKALQKQREKAVAPYPEDLIDCLQRDTAWWKSHRWSRPPGSAAGNLLASRRLASGRRSATAAAATGQTSRGDASGSDHVERQPFCVAARPSNSSTSRVAPRGNRAAGRQWPARIMPRGDRSRRTQGQALTHGHQHAHILPLDLDRDQHIDHVLVYAKMGLGELAQRAIRGLKRTWAKGGVGDLQLAVAGIGSLDDLRRLPAPLDRAVEGLLGPQRGARAWSSASPFVPPRYLKARGKNSLAAQVRAELASRGLATQVAVAVLPWSGASLPLRHFVRRRARGGLPPPMDVGFALQLHFDEPIAGPIVLGYGCHLASAFSLPNRSRYARTNPPSLFDNLPNQTSISPHNLVPAG